MTESGSGIGLAQILVSTRLNSAIASVTPVSDQPAVALMTKLHRELRGQSRPGSALSAARQHVGGSLGAPSSAGFVCFGPAANTRPGTTERSKTN
jgi:CHAT domain-containing protein